VVAFLPQGVTQPVGGCGTADPWYGKAKHNQTEHFFCVKYWEIIADNLSSRLELGWVLALDA
jgi:hypothetical protein